MRRSPRQAIKLVFDFDNILADSYHYDDGGVNVEEATLKAAKKIFGNNGQFDSLIQTLFWNIKGLNNRRPAEFVEALLKEADHLDQEQGEGHITIPALLENAKSFYLKRKGSKELDSVPEGKGFPMEALETAPVGSEDFIKGLTELMVREKLAMLLPQIKTEGNKVWPLPMPGVAEALDALALMRIELKKKGIDLDVAISTDGHEAFVRKTFEAWQAMYGLSTTILTRGKDGKVTQSSEISERSLPIVLITDDDVRGIPGEQPHPRVPLLESAWKNLERPDGGEFIFVSEEPNKIGRYKEDYQRIHGEGNLNFKGLKYGDPTKETPNAFREWDLGPNQVWGQETHLFPQGLYDASEALKGYGKKFFDQWRFAQREVYTGYEGKSPLQAAFRFLGDRVGTPRPMSIRTRK